MQHFLIWSIDHTAWWRPAELGYTRELMEAGVYAEPDVVRILARANGGGTVHEVSISVECLGEREMFLSGLLRDPTVRALLDG